MNPFDIEHEFYYSSEPSRLSKLLDRWFLYQKVIELHGSIYELGVFQGIGLIQWATFNKLTDSKFPITGFDTFGKFPDGSTHDDLEYVKKFVRNAGSESISVEYLEIILEQKGISKNVELISGDACITIPNHLEPLRPKLINLDFDLYFPSKIAINVFWNQLQEGGILILDDYDESYGVRKAVKECFGKVTPLRTPYRKLAYFIK